MSLRPPPPMRRSRTSGQEHPKIPVEPTPTSQAIYNQIRDSEARHLKQQYLHQHVTSEDHLRPPDPTAPRSITNESHLSGSLSPVSTTDTLEHLSVPEVPLVSGKRPRGRRAGPLAAEKRVKTAIKRKLGLCDHYDLSKFEEAYQATRRAPQPDSAGFSPAPTDFLGLDNNNTNLPADLSADDDLSRDFHGTLSRSYPRHQDLRNLVDSFDTSSISFGNGTLATSHGQSYNPGLSTHAQPFPTLAAPIPIGSEDVGFSARWKCEYRPLGRLDYLGRQDYLGDDCSWTGLLQDLEAHFTAEHYAFQEQEYWCYCTTCNAGSPGYNTPAFCIGSNCYGSSWKRWMFGHALSDTPALTQSGETESVHSFDARGSVDQSIFGTGWE